MNAHCVYVQGKLFLIRCKFGTLLRRFLQIDVWSMKIKMFLRFCYMNIFILKIWASEYLCIYNLKLCSYVWFGGYWINMLCRMQILFYVKNKTFLFNKHCLAYILDTWRPPPSRKERKNILGDLDTRIKVLVTSWSLFFNGLWPTYYQWCRTLGI